MSEESDFITIVGIRGKETPYYAVRDSEGVVHYIDNPEFARMILEFLHIPYTLFLHYGGDRGVKLPDGSWTGILGMANRSEVDLVLSELALTEERFEGMNFSYPVQYSPVTFATDKPRPLPTSLKIFYPFSIQMWIFVVVLLVVISFCFYVLMNRKLSYVNVATQIFGSSVQKPVHFKNDRISLRLLLFAWLFGAMIISNGYMAVLLSFLTFPTMTGIRNIRDLAKAARESSFKCFTFQGSYFEHGFLESGESSRVAIGECLERTRMLFESEIFRTAAPGKAFIGSFLNVFRFHYFVSEDSFYFGMYGYPYSKTFCCPKRLNRIIHRLHAAGLSGKIESDNMFYRMLLHHSRVAKSREFDSPTIRKLNLDDLSGAFCILICGWIWSFLTAILEILVRKLSPKKKRLARVLKYNKRGRKQRPKIRHSKITYFERGM